MSRTTHINIPSQIPIQESFDLSLFNTMAVPSTAQYFCQAHTPEQVISAVNWANAHKLPITLLGGGSNVLLAESVEGLVLQPKLMGKVKKNLGDEVDVTLGAGEPWHNVVEWALANNLYGLENLALIPGSVGAAPVQNIGAYGVELSQVFKSLTALNLQTLKIEEITKAECAFGYRDSVFKHVTGRWVILSVHLRLSCTPSSITHYPAIASYLNKNSIHNPSPTDVFEAVCSIRQQKLPAPEVLPNSGSFFKNPIVTNDKHASLMARFPGIVAYDVPNDDCKKLAAGWLIEQAGWKGRGLAGVKTHDQQALVIVNPLKRPITEVLALAAIIQQSVADQFGVELEVEPQAVGFN